MKEHGSKITTADTQLFVSSAANALAPRMGMRQWHTPPVLADLLMQPLHDRHTAAADLWGCGQGNLLDAFLRRKTPPGTTQHPGNLTPSRRTYGIELDSTAIHDSKKGKPLRGRHHGDITHCFEPLLTLGWSCPLLLANPPYSLQWHRSRLDALDTKYNIHPDWQQVRDDETAARQATEREPTNWRHWAILSRIEAERGRVDARG